MKIKFDTKLKILIVFISIFFLLGIAGLSYAFFDAIVTGTGNRNLIISGDVSLSFSDNTSISLDSIMPGDYTVKTFSVENTGAMDLYYNIGWAEYENTFINNEIYIEGTCTRYDTSSGNNVVSGTCQDIISRPIKNGNEYIKENVFIEQDVMHEYTIKITFIDTGSNQNYNKNKTFSGILKIEGEEQASEHFIALCDNDSDTLICKILEHNMSYPDNVNSKNVINTTPGINYAAISSDTNGKGLYYTTDPNKTIDVNNDGLGEKVFFFRGEVSSNYVLFADYCWKIVRTTEDDGAKLMYWGPSDEGTCSSTATSIAYSAYGNSHVMSRVGYMHGLDTVTTDENRCLKLVDDAVTILDGISSESDCIDSSGKWTTTAYEATAANVKDSNIKTIIDNWYNLQLSEYSSYILDTIYCNDRQAFTSVDNVLVEGGGYGEVTTDFATKIRLSTYYAPNYLCTQNNDRFTVSNELGNQDLTYPIALLTADEITYAGGTFNNVNSTFFLNVEGNGYSTMTPFEFLNYPRNFVYTSNKLSRGMTASFLDIYPVITVYLSMPVIRGVGTTTEPYVLTE